MTAPVRICPQCGSEYSTDIKFCPKDGTTLRVPPGAALLGAVLADRYHILRKLGEGGMGQVFLAEHVKMGRPSAIKVMAPAMMKDADAVSRFNREAANASRINHPNVAAIYDFGETPDGLIYLAMEYVEGAPLTTIIARGGPLPPARAVSIISQTASALDAAHDRGIVHRDLKPDNIMIGRNRDGSDLVKVVDFGIAKSQTGPGQKVTKTGLVVGTPEYMSPEQLAGDAVDARSDTYALALVAFNMLTGALPYDEGSAQEMMIRRLTSEPRTLAEVRGDVAWPPALERAIARALTRDASKRPESSGAFAAEFAKALEGVQIAEGEGATKRMSAFPATRVDDGAATAVAPKPTRRATAAAPVRRSSKRVWLAGGAGAAALIIAIAVLRNAPVRSAAQQPADSTTKTFSRAIDSGAAHESTNAAGTVSPSPAPAPPPPPPAPSSAKHVEPRPSTVAARPAGAPPPAPIIVPPTDVPPDTEQVDVPVLSEGHTRPATPLESARAVQEVQKASRLVAEGRPGVALSALRNQIPFLPTHDDSVKALYTASEALFSLADKTGQSKMKERGCQILRRLRSDSSRFMKSSINYMFEQECK